MNEERKTPQRRIRKRHIGSVFMIIVLIIVGVYVVYRVNAEAHASGQRDQLSERAKEFIAKDTSDGEGVWSTTNFNKNPDVITPDNPASGVSTPCFSFTVPVASTNYSQEQIGLRCTFRAKILNPIQQLVVSSYPTTNPDEDTGLLLRQKETEQYEQIPFEPQDFKKAWMYRGEDHMTAFAWKNGRMITISINGVAQPDQLDPKIYERILNSMTIKYDVKLPSPTPSPSPTPKPSSAPKSSNSATIKKQ